MKTKFKSHFICYYTPRELARSLDPSEVAKEQGEYVEGKYYSDEIY